jgi:Lrp/AsnC family transcriptional regulator, leucine-responsive regulatory protein
MDQTDKQLLGHLQCDAKLSQAELAKKVGLSIPGVHKRIKRLEASGVIKATVTHLNRLALGLDLLCFVAVTFKTNNNPENQSNLRAVTAQLPEVLECYWLTGSSDALLKVVVRDHQSLGAFLKRLSGVQDVIEKVQTSIVLEELKETHHLPLESSSEGFDDSRNL